MSRPTQHEITVERLAKAEPLDFPWFNWEESFDALAQFKIQPSFAFQKGVPLIMIAILLWFSERFYLRHPIGTFHPVAALALRYAAITATASAVLAIGYYECFRRTRRLEIWEFRAYSVCGVFLKKMSSASIMEDGFAWLVRQTLLDYLFDVWRVEIYTDFSMDDSMYLIPSLSMKDAFDFLDMLVRETERTIGISDKVLAVERDLQ